MKKVIPILALLLGSLVGNAQQDPMYTQYMFNMLTVNPAYAGSRGMLSAVALVREQWVGIEGRPRTQTVSLHTPLPRNGLSGGLSIIKDEAGPINNTGIHVDGAYRIRLAGLNQFISFGLKAGVNLFQARLSTLVLNESGDSQFAQDIQNKALPNFGFGVYYSTPIFYAGASAPRLFNNNIKNATGGNFTTMKRHLFLTAGLIVNVNGGFLKFKPSALLKAVEGAPLELDLSAAFILREKVTLGAMYRIEDAIGAFIQYQFTDQFRAGYAYDFTITSMRTDNNLGTHEIMLGYDLYYNLSKMKTPRHF